MPPGLSRQRTRTPKSLHVATTSRKREGCSSKPAQRIRSTSLEFSQTGPARCFSCYTSRRVEKRTILPECMLDLTPNQGRPLRRLTQKSDLSTRLRSEEHTSELQSR